MPPSSGIFQMQSVRISGFERCGQTAQVRFGFGEKPVVEGKHGVIKK